MANNICAVICSRQNTDEVDNDKINNAIGNALRLGIDTFYIGLDSQIEHRVLSAIQQLMPTTNITVVCVVAYLPQQIPSSYMPTIYPELESTPYRYRISARNRWMIDQCSCMITYVPYNWGGAYKSTQYAIRKGKTIIYI